MQKGTFKNILPKEKKSEIKLLKEVGFIPLLPFPYDCKLVELA